MQLCCLLQSPSSELAQHRRWVSWRSSRWQLFTSLSASGSSNSRESSQDQRVWWTWEQPTVRLAECHMSYVLSFFWKCRCCLSSPCKIWRSVSFILICSCRHCTGPVHRSKTPTGDMRQRLQLSLTSIFILHLECPLQIFAPTISCFSWALSGAFAKLFHNMEAGGRRPPGIAYFVPGAKLLASRRSAPQHCHILRPPSRITAQFCQDKAG